MDESVAGDAPKGGGQSPEASAPQARRQDSDALKPLKSRDGMEDSPSSDLLVEPAKNPRFSQRFTVGSLAGATAAAGMELSSSLLKPKPQGARSNSMASASSVQSHVSETQSQRGSAETARSAAGAAGSKDSASQPLRAAPPHAMSVREEMGTSFFSQQGDQKANRSFASAKDVAKDAMQGRLSTVATPDFAQVFLEELKTINEQFEAREGMTRVPSQDEGPEERFSLCFSGGGIRAAAFQSGVLWRLAEEGLLKNVDYFCAVSGGAYIASAFISHLQAETPRQGDTVDEFYLGVVAKTITRMQKNAGNFIRDPAQTGWRTSASRWDLSAAVAGDFPPRWADGFIVILYLVAAIVINPLTLILMVIVPMVEVVHLYYANHLRAGWCSGELLVDQSSKRAIDLLYVCIGLSIASFISFILEAVSPKDKDLYLWMRGFKALFTRAFIAAVMIAGICFLNPFVQDFVYGAAKDGPDGNLCHWYAMQLVFGGAEQKCADYDEAFVSWVERTNFLDGFNVSAGIPDVPPPLRVQAGFLTSFWSAIGMTFLIFLLLMPVNPDLLIQLVVWSVPGLIFAGLAGFVNWRVFGPMTGQSFLGYAFDTEWYDDSIYWYAMLWVIMLVFYSELRRTWHIFYKRSLMKNFFHNGQDSNFVDHLDNPFCPLMIYTGTVNDFSAPGGATSISEISFSPLHMGGPSTGYVRMDRYNTLAKMTALTGAGCLDAVSLSLSSDVRYRLWLTLCDLCWGDYLLFLPEERQYTTLVKKFCGRKISKLAKEIRFLDWLLHRVPEIIGLLTCFLLFGVGYVTSVVKEPSQCQTSILFMSSAVFLALTVVSMSFFAFSPKLRWWSFSPLLRQYHQLTRFTFEDRKAPGVLYVTDGGVQDCTGVLQMLRRRRLRILLASAGADNNDELGVVKVMIKMAHTERLASFFDPQNPKRDLDLLFEEFKNDKEMLYLHIGIYYQANEELGEGEAVGRLVIVKNRLPPSWTEEGNPWRFEIQELLTEKEIRTGRTGYTSALDDHEARQSNDPIFKLHPEDLGGVGCCDCCHRRGWNCGRKFPNLIGLNYMVLSPQLFNCAVRLGRAVAPAGIMEVFQMQEACGRSTTPTPNSGRRWRQSIKAMQGFGMVRPDPS